MTYTMINESGTDTTKYPELDQKSTEGQNQITIGDMHASATKFLYMLVRHGIVGINKEDYTRFVEICDKNAFENIENKDIEDITKIISQLEIKNNTVMVRLIGDELADRNRNPDLFILQMLAKLYQSKVPVEVLLSNHSIELLKCAELMRTMDAENNPMEERFNSDCALGIQQAFSLYALQSIISNESIKSVTMESVLKLIDDSYKPILKAISYSLDTEKNSITIYSHAAIDVDVINILAQKLNVPFNANSPVELAKTIDAINQGCAALIKNNKLCSTLYPNVDDSPLKSTPLTFVMWNRSENLIDRDYKALDSKSDYKKFQVNFVHGHDSSVSPFKNVVNLDNDLNKRNNLPGTYTVLISDETLAYTPDVAQQTLAVASASSVVSNNNSVRDEEMTDEEKRMLPIIKKMLVDMGMNIPSSAAPVSSNNNVQNPRGMNASQNNVQQTTSAQQATSAQQNSSAATSSRTGMFSRVVGGFRDMLPKSTSNSFYNNNNNPF